MCLVAPLVSGAGQAQARCSRSIAAQDERQVDLKVRPVVVQDGAGGDAPGDDRSAGGDIERHGKGLVRFEVLVAVDGDGNGLQGLASGEGERAAFRKRRLLTVRSSNSRLNISATWLMV